MTSSAPLDPEQRTATIDAHRATAPRVYTRTHSSRDQSMRIMEAQTANIFDRGDR
jgi:hypothetical protein